MPYLPARETMQQTKQRFTDAHKEPFWSVVCADLARTHNLAEPITSAARVVLFLKTAPTIKSVAIIGYRLSRVLVPITTTGAALMKQLTHVLTGADIAIGADIGRGMRLLHPTGVVIAEGTRIGANCTIHQGVTLGSSPDGSPQLGNGVRLAPGCRVLGAVVVGDGCHIGANAVMTRTLPGSNKVFAGVPARELRDVTGQQHAGPSESPISRPGPQPRQ